MQVPVLHKCLIATILKKISVLGKELPRTVFSTLLSSPLSIGLSWAYRYSIYIVVLEHFILSDVLFSYYFLKFAFMYPNGLLLHFIHGGSTGGISIGCLAVFLKCFLSRLTYHAPATATFVSILMSNSFLIFVSINCLDCP
ncbi:hypothetical protein RYX36_021534 [Vicia faba]